MESKQPKKGRPSFWPEELGEVVPKGRDFPPKIWELLDDKRTKKVLNKMAIDESYRDQVWESAQEKTPPY